jgi:hypothetical protein
MKEINVQFLTDTTDFQQEFYCVRFYPQERRANLIVDNINPSTRSMLITDHLSSLLYEYHLKGKEIHRQNQKVAERLNGVANILSATLKIQKGSRRE